MSDQSDQSDQSDSRHLYYRPQAAAYGGIRYNIVRRTPASPRDRIGKIWECMRVYGKRAKPAAAGRRSAPAGNTPGNAPLVTRTLSHQLAAILSYSPILSHTLPYFPIKSRHQPHRPRMRRKAHNAIAGNIASSWRVLQGESRGSVPSYSTEAKDAVRLARCRKIACLKYGIRR